MCVLILHLTHLLPHPSSHSLASSSLISLPHLLFLHLTPSLPHPSSHSLTTSSIISLPHHLIHHLTPSHPLPSSHSFTTSSIISLPHLLIHHLTPSYPLSSSPSLTSSPSSHSVTTSSTWLTSWSPENYHWKLTITVSQFIKAVLLSVAISWQLNAVLYRCGVHKAWPLLGAGRDLASRERG